MLLIKDWLNYSIRQGYFEINESHLAKTETILSKLMGEPIYREALLKIGRQLESFSIVQHLTN